MSVDLSELIERVEKCSGPDRELDRMIFALLSRGWSFPLRGAGLEEWRAAIEYGINTHYTSSLDAALALVEEKFPGCEISISRDATSPEWMADICDGRQAICSENGPNPAVAVLSALLRALSNGARTEAVTNEGRE